LILAPCRRCQCHGDSEPESRRRRARPRSESRRGTPSLSQAGPAGGPLPGPPGPAAVGAATGGRVRRDSENACTVTAAPSLPVKRPSRPPGRDPTVPGAAAPVHHDSRTSTSGTFVPYDIIYDLRLWLMVMPQILSMISSMISLSHGYDQLYYDIIL
jgi:hypothetical protein